MTAGTAAGPLPARPVSRFAGTSVCELAGLRLLPGRSGPVFEDDVWDFTSVAGLPAQMQPSYRRWDFTAIAQPAWRLTAKELIMALLAPHHEKVAVLAHASRTPLHIRTCQSRFAELVRFLNWLHDQGMTDLGELAGHHCDAYLSERRHRYDADGRLAGERSPTTAWRAAMAISSLAGYRELFSGQAPPAGLRPFAGAAPFRIAGYPRRAENKTPPVPDAVLTPMPGAALYVSATLGPHVASLAASVQQAQQLRASLPRPRTQRPAAQLTAVLQRLRDRGEALPRAHDHHVRARLSAGWSTDDPLLTVNFDMIARQAGVTEFPARWLPGTRGQLEATAAAVGIEKPFGRNAGPVPRADQAAAVPWTLPMDQHRANDLIGMTKTACIIVIAAISGMRASELMELTAGSCLPPEEPHPGLLRYRLAGRLIKGQPLGGTAEHWIVIQPVHQAAQLAVRLLGNDTGPGTPLLGRFTFTPRYQTFRNWVNGPAGQRLGLAPIPGGHVTPQMLRRTLALELAHRPGGVLAAKIHLKHVSVATTEGYAARPGGAQARLLAEVNAEEAERNLNLVLAEFRNYQHGVLPAGPGARELTAFFASVDGQPVAPGGPKVHRSDRDILNLLSKRAGVLHLGTANYCWFTDPSRALCLKLAGTPAAAKPLIGMCDSARCPQATHHPGHREIWAGHAAATKTFLGSIGRGRATERARLQADHDRAARVVAEIDAATTPEPGPCA